MCSPICFPDTTLTITNWCVTYFLSRPCFPFVRADWPDHFNHNENFTFNQNYPVRSVRSQIAYIKEMVFQQKLLEKSMFHCQNDLSSYGTASQFWLLEGVLGRKLVHLLFCVKCVNNNFVLFYLIFLQEISLTLLSLYLRPKVNI